MRDGILKSKHPCPACREYLNVDFHDSGKVILWCGVGRCPCDLMNDGEQGATEEEAHRKLGQIYDQWNPRE